MNPKSLAICVFCGSGSGADPLYAEAAATLGKLIAGRGHTLVFGGGGPGLMGVVARAARAGGAKVSGVLPDFLRTLERPPEWEEDLEITPDLQMRKTRLLELADGFAVLPGGAGTLDEFFEVLTSAQLRVLQKPLVLIDLKDFFAPLETLLGHLVAEGFAQPSLLKLYASAQTPEAALDFIEKKLGFRR